MRSLQYQEKKLYMDNVPLTEIAACWQTPTYVYSAQEIIQNMQAYQNGLQDHAYRLCFAVKSNSNLSILQLIAKQGWSFEVVSGGELACVLRAGAKANSVIFTGVGKTATEIAYALQEGIFCFTVESSNELLRIQKIAEELDIIAPISLRINPDVDSKTHPHISTGKACHKFGMSMEQAMSLLNIPATTSLFPQAGEGAHRADKGILRNNKYLQLRGIACHIGSQITDTEPFLLALDKMMAFMHSLEETGLHLSFLNLGGGLGIDYQNSSPPQIKEFTAQLSNKIKKLPYTLILEPGRSIVATAGILLSRVEYIKETPEKNFVIIDCAMNDLLRPALYSGWHQIIPVQQYENLLPIHCDVVGPICETTDVLGSNRVLAIKEDDLVAIADVGAYGFSMSSTYNSRPRVAEVLIENGKPRLIRERENYEVLYSAQIDYLVKD